MDVVLAVDVGKTGARAAVCVDGTTGPVAEVAGAPGLAARGGVAAAESAVLAATRATGVSRFAAVCVGAAGAVAAPDAARELARRLLAALPADQVAVGSDAVTSHAGALGGGAGVVLALGTGAVAIGIGAVGIGVDGRFAYVDGWGPWLGDEGGGAWIGLAGLRAALAAHDGRGPDTTLLAAAVDRFGDPVALPATIDMDGSPARTAAAFAPAVARAAEAGDAAAVTIMNRAAAALAATARTAARRVGATELALTGGLLRLGPILTAPLLAALDGLTVREAAGGSLDGALLLALRRDTPHEPMLARVPR